MLAVKFGVVKLLPEDNRFPPVAASYHSTLPVAVAVKIVEVPRQIFVLPLMVGCDGLGVKVTFTAVRGPVQLPSVAAT